MSDLRPDFQSLSSLQTRVANIVADYEAKNVAHLTQIGTRGDFGFGNGQGRTQAHRFFAFTKLINANQFPLANRPDAALFNLFDLGNLAPSERIKELDFKCAQGRRKFFAVFELNLAQHLQIVVVESKRGVASHRQA